MNPGFISSLLTVFSHLHDLLVEDLLVLGLDGEGQGVPGHGGPGTDLHQPALLVLAGQVTQDRPVIDECV